MAEEEFYEPDLISVTDENGDEILFELLERYFLMFKNSLKMILISSNIIVILNLIKIFKIQDFLMSS